MTRGGRGRSKWAFGRCPSPTVKARLGRRQVCLVLVPPPDLRAVVMVGRHAVVSIYVC